MSIARLDKKISQEIKEESFESKKEKVRDAIKTNWGKLAFDVHYREYCTESYWTPYAPENDIKRHKEEENNCLIKFFTEFSHASNSPEARMALIRDAQLLDEALKCLTYIFVGNSVWHELNDSDRELISSEIGISVDIISKLANYKKIVGEIFKLLGGSYSGTTEPLVKLTLLLKNVNEYNYSDINQVRSPEEDLLLIDYLVHRGCYNLVDKFKIITSSGFRINKAKAADLLEIMCRLHANNPDLLAEILKHVDLENLNSIKTTRFASGKGQVILHPVILILEAMEKHEIMERDPDLNPYLRSIQLLFSAGFSVTPMVMNKLLAFPNNQRYDKFLNNMLSHQGFAPIDRNRILEKLANTDKEEKTSKDLKNKVNTDLMTHDYDENEKIIKILEILLEEKNIRISYEGSITITFQIKDKIKNHCRKLKNIGVDANLKDKLGLFGGKDLEIFEDKLNLMNKLSKWLNNGSHLYHIS